MVNSFIENNSFWLVPVVSIILTIVIKIASKPESTALSLADYFDFGYDLSIGSILILLTGTQSVTSAWLVIFGFILILITVAVTQRAGWHKSTNQPNLFGIIFPDAIGLILIVIATLYIRGVIK